MTVEHEKIPAQGGEMPPVERAADTGSRGASTVPAAISAGNAAQDRNTNAVLTDEQILALNAGEIHFSESPSKYPEFGHGTQYHAGAPGVLSFARAVERAALLTSPRAAGLPGHVRFSMESTARWLEGGCDPLAAAKEIRACLAKFDAAPAAPVAQPRAHDGLTEEFIDETVRLANDAPGIREAVESALQSCSAQIVPVAAQAVAADGKALDEDRIDWIANAHCPGGTAYPVNVKNAIREALREARAAVSPATADGLPVWFDTFLMNVCEIPDRNSPEGEPEAIVATLDELKSCAISAIEECSPAPATADERPAFDAWLAAEYPDVAAAMKNEFTNPDVVESVDMARAAWNRASKGDALVSSRLAALEEENRELAEFVIAVGGFWGESRSKLVGPLSLAEIIKQAMREQVSTPADHCLRAPTICAGVAAAPDEARRTCTCSGLGPCERRTDGSCRVSAPADARDAATFIREVAAQKPEKPDYWSPCGQCQRNAERAQDLLDAACAQSIDLPDSEGGEA
ncbi:hypothetical protein [Burkholderia gladioli]|uniref:hypothetical protein n=1 Tax=Burkholderia gladioli TaxID=28095 RepID=UPI003EE1B0DE